MISQRAVKISPASTGQNADTVDLIGSCDMCAPDSNSSSAADSRCRLSG